MTKFKITARLMGDHVHVTFFAGKEDFTKACLGSLVFGLGEWQIFGASLLRGALEHDGHIEVEIDEDIGAVAAEESLRCK